MPSRTGNKLLVAPTVAGDTGTWGNNNGGLNETVLASDGIVGGVLSLGVSTLNVTLTDPGAPTPGAGPTQAQNALLRFTGTLLNTLTVTNRLPGWYTVENRCTVGAFNLILSNGGGGEKVALPPFEMVDVFSDGTNIRFRNMGRVGEYLFLAGTTVPAWINACDVPPYLLCDGTNTYLTSTYTALSNFLGTNFGNPGGGHFQVPDLRGRLPLAMDPTGTRVTGASGINGNTLGAVGGDQLAQAHAHGVNDPQHSHAADGGGAVYGGNQNGVVSFAPGNNPGVSALQATSPFDLRSVPTSTVGTGVSVNSALSGGSQNMPPVQVAGIWLIKT